MTFTITAELPLGTYQGAGPDGRPEPMPSLVRLHAALLSAAGFGPRAMPDGDELRPCDADETALRWLEEHPPEGVVIPEITVTMVDGTAYRDDGTVRKGRDGRLRIKKLPKAPGTSVAVGGRFVWSWRDQPPASVRDALAALCRDVPYLGTTESPVRLITGSAEVESTHDLDREAGMFAAGGRDIDVCRPGRTAELVAAHARRTAVPRSDSKSGYGTNEESMSDVPPRRFVEPLRYLPRGDTSAGTPWGRAILLPLSRSVEPRYRVAWAVAAHRALINRIGYGAPSLVTGVYSTTAVRPANRLALHLLDGSTPIAGGIQSPGVLVVLVPAGADAADVEIVASALGDLDSVRGPGGQLARVAGDIRIVSGAWFWTPPLPGQLRLWRTEPAAVPDTRGVRGVEWTFAHAALLSLGFVWKDHLPNIRGRGDAYHLGLAQAVTEAGAAVVHTAPVRTTHVGAYAHRVNDGAVVRPYTACVWLGDLAGPGTVAAIGQSRHLGGGLLVPHDMSDDADPADGKGVRL